jgi:hypothetical protein
VKSARRQCPPQVGVHDLPDIAPHSEGNLLPAFVLHDIPTAFCIPQGIGFLKITQYLSDSDWLNNLFRKEQVR